MHGVTHGCISLVQMNKGASPLDPKRFFKDDVKKCDELERVLSNINAELQVSRRRHPVPLSQRLHQMAAFNPARPPTSTLLPARRPARRPPAFEQENAVKLGMLDSNTVQLSALEPIILQTAEEIRGL